LVKNRIGALRIISVGVLWYEKEASTDYIPNEADREKKTKLGEKRTRGEDFIRVNRANPLNRTAYEAKLGDKS